jgi:hypothetical protein
VARKGRHPKHAALEGPPQDIEKVRGNPSLCSNILSQKSRQNILYTNPLYTEEKWAYHEQNPGSAPLQDDEEEE